MAKSCLITGGSGFIGAALARALVLSGCNVRILDNQQRGDLRRLKNIDGNYDFIEGDVRNIDVVSKAVKGMDCVYHLAFINGTEFFYTMPELVLDVGVKGIINVIDACKKNNVSELILASSSEVYQTPAKIPTAEDVPLIIPDVFNPRYSYAAGKIISEVMAVNYGRKYFQRMMIFRPHNVYGPDMGREHVIPQFILRMKELKSEAKSIVPFPIQGTGKETRAFIYIDDFIAALMLIIKFGEHMQIYHIGSEDEITIEKLAVLVADYFSCKIEIVIGKVAVGGTLRRCPDITKIRQLGFCPKVDLKTGITATAQWYGINQY